MARATRDGHFGFEPLTAFFNAIVWISAVICMGILSYFISLDNHQGSHVIYEEVIAVLTVAFFLVTFFIGATGHLLLFNLIFSYLWLVSVVFTANDWTYSHYPLAQTVEAFSFIAL
ncbi:hypothetical protein BX600DRAFT_460960 [Xylariales sp. PMI_506]|nr:hypothetical protein BX600DRAFT_460960 [Xylariales sp. PMI_506]